MYFECEINTLILIQSTFGGYRKSELDEDNLTEDTDPISSTLFV